MRTIRSAALGIIIVSLTLLALPASSFAQRGGRGGGAQQGDQAAAPAVADAAAPAGNADNGKKLWNTVGCYQCHGYAGQGGVGARLAPNVPAFTALVKYVRSPKGEMPPYTSKVLSDAQLADIYAYLKSVPKPPDPKSIPLLNQ